MTKTVKITSRGRYVCPDGKVLFGPTGNWFKEDTNTLKALLIGYPNIDIVERTESKKIVNINITNVNTNNESEPVSMMEDVTPVNKDAEKVDEPAGEVPAEDITEPVDEAPAEEVPVEETPVEAEKPADTTTNTQTQTQSKKNKKRHNKSTEVTPKEA